MDKIIKNLGALADVVGALRSERDACNEATKGLIEATKSAVHKEAKLDYREDLLEQKLELLHRFIVDKGSADLLDEYERALQDMEIKQQIYDMELDDEC